MSILNNLSQSLCRAKTDKTALLMLVGAVSQFLAFVFWFVPIFKFSVNSDYSDFYGDDFTSYVKSGFGNNEIFEDAFVLQAFFWIFMLLSLFFLAKPFFTNKFEVRNREIMAKISSILILTVFLWMYSVYVSSAKDYSDMGITGCRFTLGGWLFMLSNISVLVTSFMISAKTKKFPKKAVESISA